MDYDGELGPLLNKEHGKMWKRIQILEDGRALLKGQIIGN